MMRKGDEMRALQARGLVLNCDFARGGARPRCGGALGGGRDALGENGRRVLVPGGDGERARRNGRDSGRGFES